MKSPFWPFKIIKKSFIWIIISVLLIVAGAVLFTLNFKPSIEFTGGIELSLSQVQNSETLVSSINTILDEEGFTNPQTALETSNDTTKVIVALPFESDEQVKQVSEKINALLIENQYIMSEDNIIGLALNGPSVSSYMKSSAINALITGFVLIAIYMMFSFMAMRKHISPLVLAGVVLMTSIFDILIPAGAYGLWMAFDSTITVNTTFIIAMLTILWYSINDTIIILDRVRENTIRHKEQLENGQLLYGNLIEQSVWQTMRRSIGTSLTTFLVVAAMFVFWASAMQQFAFTMGIGVIAGSFSSIFLAAPLLYIFLNRRQTEMKKL